MRVHPKPRGPRHEVAMRKGGEVEDWELERYRGMKNNKSPTVESKELYSNFSDDPHEK